MYQPALRPDQIKALYYLKEKLARPMTELARDAVDDYLRHFGGAKKIIPAVELSDGSGQLDAAEPCGR